MEADLWVFGYGSLVWRPDFPFVEQLPGHIEGVARRFWQGSPDHRGTRSQPGRVVTLTVAPGARCGGVAFRVAPTDRAAVLATLDERESGGFRRERRSCHFARSARGSVEVLVYVAAQDNPNFLGPAPIEQMVEQMRRAAGRSGTNADYVLRLAESLRGLAIEDPHVFELAARLARTRRAGRSIL